MSTSSAGVVTRLVNEKVDLPAALNAVLAERLIPAKFFVNGLVRAMGARSLNQTARRACSIRLIIVSRPATSTGFFSTATPG